MGKTIRFNENGLIALKKRLNEIMVGTPGVSHNDVCEEVGEEFAPVGKIGGEEKNGDVLAGGNYFHMEQVEENVEKEVESSEVDLSSFKKRDSLPPKIWKDEETLDSRVRLKLLDIADDFWEFVNLSWVEPKGIIITGSICNFNWSKFSDIDLHLIVDFSEIDSKTEFVKQYLDSKKNEWNTEHEGLKIMGFPVELYVQDVNENPEAGGIYDLEENTWIRKPNPHTIKSIGLNKFGIKDKAAEIMTIIDDMYDTMMSTSDGHVLDQVGEDAHYLWDKVKDLRKKSLNRNGESGSGNIVYKVLRRTGYLDKLFKLFSTVYDRSNSITESIGYDGDIFELAKKHFGTTHDIRECGYVLPDGTMLDFSGRHTLNPGTDSSHLKGRRGIDHREIYEIGWDETGNVKNFDYTMEDFIKAGAIRVHVTSKYSSINLYKKPTTYQIPVLISIIQYAKGCVDVEIGDGDESLSYAEYEGVKARKPIADILRYFDEGINLVSESKEVLKEFLEKDHNIFLYTYFQWAEKASDRDKVEDLFYHCPYIMSEYLSDVSGYDEELSNLEDELANDSDLEYDDEFIERLLDALERHNLLREVLNNPYKYADAEELPAWFTMHFIRVVKNEWCIHFTEDADSIAKNGFTGGTEEIENLAYTGAGRQKRGEGYDFAFLLGDSGVDFNNYGSEAVIFRTSGVLLLHYGDEQRQVVFWGPNVKSFIPVVRNYGDWVVYGNKGQILMSTSNPSEIADWATNNLPQYRKQIMTGKNGYIPKRSIFDKEKNKYVREPYPIYKNESVKKYLTLLKEEVALDGSTEDNPYEKRWKAEREALKNFVANYGKLMQSREDNKMGRLYKVYYDETMSNLIGYNYCICVQWDELTMKPKSTVYIRALDKFTPFIRRNLQFDTRGRDNMRGTYDDTGY